MLLVILVANSSTRVDASTNGAPLQRFTVSPFANVLVDAHHHSYYVLSVEHARKLYCTAACLSFWHPFLVGWSVTSVKLGRGVAGRISFVVRSSSSQQVAFNGYPVYTFTGDSGPGQSHGQGLNADGGTWHLTDARARTPASTRLSTPSATTTTTTAPGATTTTTAAPVTITTAPVTTTVYVYP